MISISLYFTITMIQPVDKMEYKQDDQSIPDVYTETAYHPLW